ncbi:MAG: preprotein translocase subunit SecE [Oscillospiraceae bacterium]|nr:preprotein translocase subunit SecE [Oscillospiraceae bacterium]
MAKEKKDTLKKADASAKEETKKAKKSESKSKKDAKKDEGKKGGIIKWFRDLKIEFKNVTWPTKKTVFINTSVVLGTIVFASLVVGLLDFGLLELIKFLLGLSQ